MRAAAWVLGRLLQFLGLVILPVALWRGFETNDPWHELKLMAVGGVVFLVGLALTRSSGGAAE